MVNPFSPISFADLQTLATLVNAKLSGVSGNTYAFTSFVGSDQIGMPSDISIRPTYGSGQFTAGRKVTAWIFGYKTIAGVKTYTWTPIKKAFLPKASEGQFSLQWNWETPALNPPDGYVFVIPFLNHNTGPNSEIPAYQYIWQDIGNVTSFSEDGSFSSPAWFLDGSLGVNTPPTTKDLPCAHGTWLKSLNQIRADLCFYSDIGAQAALKILGSSMYCRGPYCVSQGLAPLTAYFQKFTPGLPAPTSPIGPIAPAYTQTYRKLKFYFRQQDAPSGVNITSQNQLLSFPMASENGSGGNEKWPINIIACSTGHIQIKQSGTSTIFTDQDVVEGTTYDFTIQSPTPYVGPAVLLLDIIFTTPVTTSSVAGVGIEYSNDIQVATVPDSYFDMKFNNPIQDGLGHTTGFNLAYTNGTPVFTENNGTPGVWTGMTLPTKGLLTFLDQDLPQYSPTDDGNISSRRVPLGNNSLPYIGTVADRSALWPIFRDTDFMPDSFNGQPLNGSKAWQASIANKFVGSQQLSNVIPRFVDTGQLFLFSFNMIPDDGITNTVDARFFSSQFAIYIKINSPPTLTDYDATVPAGQWISLASAFPGFNSGPNNGGTIFVGVYNSSAAAANNQLTFVEINSADAPNGTFFPMRDTGLGLAPQLEGFSYSFFNNLSGSVTYPIPQFGYCVFSITARRQPKDNGFGVAAAPTAGTADLSIDIGIMEGFGFDTQGTFTKLQTITIPAGQASVTVPAFLPVLSGTPLAYQCSEVVHIRPAVNFQPQMHSQWNPTTDVSDSLIGYFDGPAWFDQNEALLSFLENDVMAGIVVPVASVIFNDLTTLLNVL